MCVQHVFSLIFRVNSRLVTGYWDSSVDLKQYSVHCAVECELECIVQVAVQCTVECKVESVIKLAVQWPVECAV